MRMYDIILKKREGLNLSREEIRFFIDNYVKGNIPDYQASAFLMAAFIKGLNDSEMTELTIAMADSGEKINLSGVNGVIADKHSTGGVADTTTFIVAPIVAACGIKMAKMSGRGLGHTGGTIDKIESIPGLNTSLSMEEFISQLNEIGLVVMGQTLSICPADKKLYALRDVTATVENIPLIASSVMSKKIASGASTIVLDVKTGNGALMKSYQDSLQLAEKMVRIGDQAGRRVSALITDMSQPLGQAVGNSLEVKEVIEILKNNREGDLKELSIMLAAEIIKTAGLTECYDNALELANESLIKGNALKKFEEMISAQKGDPTIIDHPDAINKSAIQYDLCSDDNGYISEFDTYSIGIASVELGAGRKIKEDTIDPSAGIWMHKRIGDKVGKGETICTLYTNDENKLRNALEKLEGFMKIVEKPCNKPKLVYSRVTEGQVTSF